MSYLLEVDEERSGTPGLIVLKPNREAHRLLCAISPTEAAKVRRRIKGCKVETKFDDYHDPFLAPEYHRPDAWVLVLVNGEGAHEIFSRGRFESKDDAEHYLWKYGIKLGVKIKP